MHGMCNRSGTGRSFERPLRATSGAPSVPGSAKKTLRCGGMGKRDGEQAHVVYSVSLPMCNVCLHVCVRSCTRWFYLFCWPWQGALWCSWSNHGHQSFGAIPAFRISHALRLYNHRSCMLSVFPVLLFPHVSSSMADL